MRKIAPLLQGSQDMTWEERLTTGHTVFDATGSCSASTCSRPAAEPPCEILQHVVVALRLKVPILFRDLIEEGGQVDVLGVT